MKFPDKCPYCNKDITPCLINDVYADTPTYSVKTELHRCRHCDEVYLLYEKRKNNNYDWDIIHCFPYNQLIVFPDKVKNLSPKCYEVYTQTISAKSAGFDTLVGAGLRIALEWLVWDYLIKIKKFTEQDLKKLSLANRIEKMNSDLYTLVCARLIRLFGNDSIHIIKMLRFSIQDAIELFEILCTLIDNELSILEANERLTNPIQTPPTAPQSQVQ